MWHNNKVQYARLLSEIYANIEFTREQKEDLAESMNLAYEDILEIFRRADKEWEEIKAEQEDERFLTKLRSRAL